MIDASYGFCLAIQFVKVERKSASFSSSRPEHPNADAQRKGRLTGDMEGRELEERGSPPAFSGSDGVESTTERSEGTPNAGPHRTIRPGSFAVRAATRFAKLASGGVSSSNGHIVSRPVADGKGEGAAIREEGGSALVSQEEKNFEPEVFGQKPRDCYAGERCSPWSPADVIEEAAGEARVLPVSGTHHGKSGTPPGESLVAGMLLPRPIAELVELGKGTASTLKHTRNRPQGVPPRGRVVPTLGCEAGEARETSFGSQLGHGSDRALGLLLSEDPHNAARFKAQESPPRSGKRALPPIIVRS